MAAVVYEPLRLLAGLSVAAILLAVAGWLIVSTDWSGPGPEGDPFEAPRSGRHHQPQSSER
jgi:hypothetical protein